MSADDSELAAFAAAIDRFNPDDFSMAECNEAERRARYEEVEDRLSGIALLFEHLSESYSTPTDGGGWQSFHVMEGAPSNRHRLLVAQRFSGITAVQHAIFNQELLINGQQELLSFEYSLDLSSPPHRFDYRKDKVQLPHGEPWTVEMIGDATLLQFSEGELDVIRGDHDYLFPVAIPQELDEVTAAAYSLRGLHFMMWKMREGDYYKPGVTAEL